MNHPSTHLDAFKRATSLELSKWYMGSLTTNLAEAKDTNGAFCLLEATLVPGNEPPPHVHSREDELFYVLEGELTVEVGDETVRLAAGGFVAVPPMVVHTFRNEGSAPARFINLHAPGQGFIEYLRALNRSGDDDARRRTIDEFDSFDADD